MRAIRGLRYFGKMLLAVNFCFCAEAGEFITSATKKLSATRTLRSRTKIGSDQNVIGMDRYWTPGFEFVNNDFTALEGENVMLGLRLQGATYRNLVMSNDVCYVSNRPNATGSPSPAQTLSLNGCGKDDILGNSNFVWVNNGTFFGFSFSAFVVSPKTETYVHCKMRICQQDSFSCKLQVCEDTVHQTGDTHFVSFGPLKIGSETSMCDKMRHGCSHGCSLNARSQVTCVCPTGLFLDLDDKTCVGWQMLANNTQEQIDRIKKLQEQTRVLTRDVCCLAMANLAVIAVILRLVGCGRFKWRTNQQGYLAHI